MNTGREPDETRTEWDTAYINDLPDSAFAYVEEGDKDEDGKTTPRSKRHFPHHDKSGALDLPHLRNALARAPQSPFGEKAMAHLEAHAKAEGIGDRDLSYERRFLPASEVRILREGKATQITWYPALFNSLSDDLGGFREIVHSSAFTKTLQEADVRALFNHNPDYVLGRSSAKTLELSITRRGLRASASPPDTAWANDLLVSIERGDISGGSFGFQMVKESWTENDDKSLVRELREVKLFDVSLVTYPAYSETNGNVILRNALLANGIDDQSFMNLLLRCQAGLSLEECDYTKFRQSIAHLLPEPREHSTVLYRYRTELQRLKG